MGLKLASRVRGLSDAAFREAFGEEEQCRAALFRLRWPRGFVCPACGQDGYCVPARRRLYQCKSPQGDRVVIRRGTGRISGREILRSGVDVSVFGYPRDGGLNLTS